MWVKLPTESILFNNRAADVSLKKSLGMIKINSPLLSKRLKHYETGLFSKLLIFETSLL